MCLITLTPLQSAILFCLSAHLNCIVLYTLVGNWSVTANVYSIFTGNCIWKGCVWTTSSSPLPSGGQNPPGNKHLWLQDEGVHCQQCHIQPYPPIPPDWTVPQVRRAPLCVCVYSKVTTQLCSEVVTELTHCTCVCTYKGQHTPSQTTVLKDAYVCRSGAMQKSDCTLNTAKKVTVHLTLPKKWWYT